MDGKKEALKDMLDDPDIEIMGINHDMIFEYAGKHQLPFDDFLVFVFNSVDKEQAYYLFTDIHAQISHKTSLLWNNASEEMKSFITEKMTQHISNLRPIRRRVSHTLGDMSKNALFDMDELPLEIDMLPYIKNSNTQRTSFENIIEVILKYDRFLEENIDSIPKPQNEEEQDLMYEEEFKFEQIGFCYGTAMDHMLDFWKSCSEETQMSLFSELIKLFPAEGYQDLFFDTCKPNVIKKNLNTLLKKGIEIDESWISQEDRIQLIIDNILSSQDVEKYKELLSDIFTEDEIQEELKGWNPDAEVEEIWNSLSKEAQKENFDKIFGLIHSSVTLRKMLNHTDYSLVQDKSKLRVLFEKCFPDQASEWININFEKYLKILSINDEVNKTINFDIFESPFLELLSVEQLARITNYPQIQEKMLEKGDFRSYEKNKTSLKISMIQYCLKNNNLNMLDKVLDSIELLDNLNLNYFSIEELMNEKTVQGMIDACLMSKNYFNVEGDRLNFQDQKRIVLDFKEWKKNVCQSVFEDMGMDVARVCPRIAQMDDITRKKFAMLQLKYGIDMKDASILVRKYADGLEKIDDLTEAERDIQKAVLGIKYVLSLDEEELDSMYEKMKEDHSLERDENVFVPITEIEQKCIGIFAKKIKNTLYTLDESDSIESTTYNGQEIKRYEVKKDFNMLVRSEGAYNPLWKAPENYQDAILTPKITYHGNCESYIGQNLIALARPKGPIFGYADCSNENLLAMAPYDLASNKSNQAFSSTNGDKTREGMDFRSPKELIDRTRHGHNETVFERLNYENGKFMKRTPGYVIWIMESSNETESDRENDEALKDRWQQTKQAAAQLNVPIVMIDREYFAKKEEEKIESLLSTYEGKNESKASFSSQELLQEMITQFENNVTGLLYSPNLNQTYFTAEKRKQMIERINKALEEKKNKDFEEYRQEVASLYSILENEKSKMYSVKGKLVATQEAQEDYYLELRERLKLEIDSFSKYSEDRREYLASLGNTAASKQVTIKKAEELEQAFMELAGESRDNLPIDNGDEL